MRCVDKRFMTIPVTSSVAFGLSFALLVLSGVSFAVDPTSGVATEVEGADPTEETESEEPKIDEPKYVPKTESELRKELSKVQYKVTQQAGTEEAFRNLYWNNKKEGLYRCIVCGQSLFSSETKYKSGTGWPSFYAPVKKKNVGYQKDWVMFYPRTEVHCSRCNAHLGHVFDDGPKDKTGKRYCMNSAAMKFESEKEKPKTISKTE